VAQGGTYASIDGGSVVCVGKDGVTVKNDIIPSVSLSYSPSLNGVVVKSLEGGVFLLRDAWMHSSRCAWLSALASY
jgi:hypothetical protein